MLKIFKMGELLIYTQGSIFSQSKGDSDYGYCG